MTSTLYDRVGGGDFFVALVDRFYDGVADDPILRPLYPDDLTDPKRWLALFLAQFWGGPSEYAQERGHPRLRMRHFPFRIAEQEAERWWHHMRAAVVASGAGPMEQEQLLAYFQSAATFLINTDAE